MWDEENTRHAFYSFCIKILFIYFQLVNQSHEKLPPLSALRENSENTTENTTEIEQQNVVSALHKIKDWVSGGHDLLHLEKPMINRSWTNF